MSWIDDLSSLAFEYLKNIRVENNKNIKPVKIKFINDHYELNNNITMSFNEIITLFEEFKNMLTIRDMSIVLSYHNSLKLYPSILSTMDFEDNKINLVDIYDKRAYYLFFKCIYDSINEYSLENDNVICFDGNKIIMRTGDDKYHFLSFASRRKPFPRKFHIECETTYSRFCKSCFSYKESKFLKNVINFTINLNNSQSVSSNADKGFFIKKYLPMFDIKN